MTSHSAQEAVQAVLRRFAGQRVAVVGDVFLDRYLIGRPERLSREGPVPVLAFQRRLVLPGGAANPARNVARLGAEARQVGVVGVDDDADELRRALRDAGIETDGLVADPSRPTTVKTRVVAEGLSERGPQQVARIDHQVREPVAPGVERALVAALGGAAADADAVLVSHYRSGVVTEAVCAAARRAVSGRAAWLTADAQGDLERFAGFHVVRVGRQDAARVIGRPLDSEAAYASATVGLRDALGARVVIVGRGRDGMSVADDRGYSVVPPVNVSEVFDVAGAGDTVIAIVTMALSAGASVRDAVALANHGAGIVVRRLGVAAPSLEEILASMATRSAASDDASA